MIAPCDPPNANQNNPEHLFSIYVLLIGSEVLHHHFQDEECTLFTSALIQPTTWVFLHVYYQFEGKKKKSAISIFFSGIKCQSMESIESTAVKKPGETLTLSCRGSGFSFSCCSMHWIRQQAGKPLVWMGRVYSDASGNEYSESFKGRIEITRDNSKSMAYGWTKTTLAVSSLVTQCQQVAAENKKIYKMQPNRHVHKSLRSKSKSSLKSLRSSLSQVSSLCSIY